MAIAKRKILSKNIVVEGVYGQNFKRNGDYVCHRIPQAEDENDFLETVEEAYLALQKLPTGKRLIDAINSSSKSCVIFCGSLRGSTMHEGAAILQNLGDKRATLERLALPFCDYGSMLIRDDTGGDATVNVEEIRQGRIDKVRAYYNNVLSETEKSFRDINLNFNIVFERVREAHPINTIDYVASKTGVAIETIKSYLDHNKKVSTSDNFRLSIGLYDYLIAGEGADVAVRLTAEIGINSRGSGTTWFQRRRGLTRYQVSTNEVRADIMLGHELVHAWRQMTGKRLVSSGWEEEMMTVGLGPAASFEFTENKLRSEAGHPLRTTYPGVQPTTIAGQEFHSACR